MTADAGPPLPLAGVTAELAPLPWIYFEAAGPAPLTARFGDPKAGAAPRYDLEALRDPMGDPVVGAHTAAARWGDALAVISVHQGVRWTYAALKARGCAVEESQLQSEASLRKWATVLSAVAMRFESFSASIAMSCVARSVSADCTE